MLIGQHRVKHTLDCKPLPNYRACVIWGDSCDPVLSFCFLLRSYLVWR